MQQFTGTEYLKIDIANCFGLDRLSWNDRMYWFDNNEHHLESQAPLAKSPILYRKAVRAMRCVQRNEMTNHVMGLDATASGLQIMGALSGCHETAKAVNLVNTGERRCVYATVAQFMSNITGNTIAREDVKKPVMTVFYGSTAQPKEIFGEGPDLVAFYEALKQKLPGAFELMGILQQHWNPLATEHQWSLPDGHIARVPVLETVEKSLEVDEADHLRFAYRSKVVCPKPKSRSLAANIVHSIDGWIVRHMVKMATSQGFWLAPIHDCFYTSPNNMDQVRDNYLRIMQWIAQSTLVSSILTEIAGQNIAYYPQSYNLSKSMASAEYALS